jgi:hypothetical protein
VVKATTTGPRSKAPCLLYRMYRRPIQMLAGRGSTQAEKPDLEALVCFALASNSPSGTFTTCAMRCLPMIKRQDATIILPLHACIAAYQTSFCLGPGTNLQDYIYVSNAADAHVLAAANLLTSQTAAGEACTPARPVPRGLERVRARAAL